MGSCLPHRKVRFFSTFLLFVKVMRTCCLQQARSGKRIGKNSPCGPSGRHSSSCLCTHYRSQGHTRLLYPDSRVTGRRLSPQRGLGPLKGHSARPPPRVTQCNVHMAGQVAWEVDNAIPHWLPGLQGQCPGQRMVLGLVQEGHGAQQGCIGLVCPASPGSLSWCWLLLSSAHGLLCPFLIYQL